MGLKDWLKNGWLVEHAPSPEETRAHLDLAARDLQDCALPGLSPDRKLAIAYAAALQAATAALAAEGFRASRDAHHFEELPQAEAEIPSGHNALIPSKLSDCGNRLWYAKQEGTKGTRLGLDLGQFLPHLRYAICSPSDQPRGLWRGFALWSQFATASPLMRECATDIAAGFKGFGYGR